MNCTPIVRLCLTIGVQFITDSSFSLDQYGNMRIKVFNAVEPFSSAHNGWEFRNEIIQELDGYNIVLGGMRKS